MTRSFQNIAQLSFILALSTGVAACGSAKKKVDEHTAAPTHESKTEAKKVEKSEPKNMSEFDCVKGSDKRHVKVVSVGAGCATQYTKHGATEDKATAVKGTQWCEDVAKKIEKHLTASGYKCE